MGWLRRVWRTRNEYLVGEIVVSQAEQGEANVLMLWSQSKPASIDSAWNAWLRKKPGLLCFPIGSADGKIVLSHFWSRSDS